MDPDAPLHGVPPLDLGECVGARGKPEPPPAELVALGAPPADAAGIQKWSYQALSIMAYDVMRNPNLTSDERMKRAAQLLTSAAKHYPEAAKHDIANKIDQDKAAMEDRKRAKAAAKVERVAAAGSAKVIPIRQGDAS